MRPVERILLSLFVILFIPFMVFAEDKADPRLITVYGDAEVRVVPDEIILKLEVITINKDINLSKKENDELSKNVLNVARKHGIEEKHIQTDFISIRPEYLSSSWPSEFRGFEASKYIVLEIRETSKFEEILSDVLSAGAHYVRTVKFQTTELKKYREQARSQAIKAAREKAVKLANELGQKVGKPHFIQEDGVQAMPTNMFGGFSNFIASQNTISSSEPSASDDSIALGQIKISAKIIVCFELIEP